mmetsp:Transcript_568/g.1014  ORF Transcript_568/g.1014 Transcript_568/m.1014 type:complete len:253 (-) Transcript_568:30-788(-)
MSWACFSLRFSQLWDLDGTLIDTSSASMITLQQLIVELGGKLELSTLVPIVEQSAAISTGQKATKSSKEHWAQQVLRVTGLEAKLTPAALVKKWEDRMIKKRADIQLMPGAMEVVSHLHNLGIPQAIATMSNSRSVAIKQRAHPEIFDLMDVVVTSDDPDVRNRKPAPDCWLTAAQRLKKKCTRCVVVEDSPEGMRSGFAAGARVVGVPAAWTSPEKIGRGVKVDYMLQRGLLDFPFKQFGLPPLPPQLTKK